MIDSVKTILDKLDYRIDDEDTRLAEFFNENGYCIIPKSLEWLIIGLCAFILTMNRAAR